MKARGPVLAVMALLLLCIGAIPVAALAAPDLVVATFDPPSGPVERTFTVLNAVRNDGNAPSGAFTVGFVLSSDTTFTPKDTLIGTREVRSLGAGAASQELFTNVTVPDPVPAGTYYLGMFVDTENAVAESDETNNLRSDPDPIAILAAHPPDIGFWFFFTQTGWVARTFTVDAEVKNYGTGPTGPFTVGFYLSSDTSFTTADTLVGEEHVDDLAADATASMYQFITVPATVPAGSYYLGMIMDPGNAVPEVNEANNVAYGQNQVVVSDLPDLVVENWLPPSGTVDRTFSVGNAVRNYGVTPAGPFTAGFYLSSDTTVTTMDALIGTRSFGGLGAGTGTPLENTTVTAPDSIPAGPYYLGMIVDPADAVDEAEEGNNIVVGAAPVTLGGSPDIQSWTFAPPSGAVARTFTIFNAVKNGGTAPSGPFTVGFYLSADTTFTTNDTLIGTRQYSDLAAGAAGQNENTAVTIPASVPAGSYYLGTIMDTGNTVAESNEHNNIMFDLDPISIAGLPDIGPSTFATFGTDLFKRYNFIGEIRNSGTVPTGPFRVGYYLSADTTFTLADTLLGVLQVADLAPNATLDLHTFLDAPGSVPAGSYYLGVIMDATNAVAESNETNNVAFDPDPVVISDLPDMYAYTFRLPGGPAARTFVITNAVKNYGMTPAGPFTVEFYLSGDSTITTADVLIGSRSYGSLEAGTAAPVTNTTVTVPGSVPAGQYYVGMIIDPANAVEEALENNNISYFLTPIAVPAVVAVVQVPTGVGLPTDTNGDGKYDDVNGNGRKDFADVVLYFNQMSWIAANEPIALFDCNGNGRIDFADVVWLFNHL